MAAFELYGVDFDYDNLPRACSICKSEGLLYMIILSIYSYLDENFNLIFNCGMILLGSDCKTTFTLHVFMIVYYVDQKTKYIILGWEGAPFWVGDYVPLHYLLS